MHVRDDHLYPTLNKTYHLWAAPNYYYGEMKNDTEFWNQLMKLESDITDEVAKFKEIRNKRFGHNDMSTYLKDKHKMIPNSAINKSIELMVAGNTLILSS